MNTFRLFSLILLAASLLLISSSAAEGTSCISYITAWPSDSLPINGRLILTGSFEYAQALKRIADYHPRLVSEHHMVPLKAGSANVSRQSMAQVVLIPTELLRTSVIYRLEIDSNALLYEDLYSEQDSSEFIWLVTGSRDDSNPSWMKNPTGAWGDTDGGWGYYYVLETLIEDENQFALEVELISEGGETQKFIITYFRYDEETKLYRLGIGQNECAGSFSVRGGEQHRALYTAIDPAGNRTACPESCMLIFGGERIGSDDRNTNDGFSMWHKVSVSQQDCMESP